MKHNTDAIATTEKNVDAKAHPDTSPKNNQGVWDGDDVVIFSYSRAQAIEDGVLMDAGKLAVEAGFRYPVALTHAAWSTCVTVPTDAVDQDETGRLWDVLNCLRIAARGKSGECLKFIVLVKTPEKKIALIELKSICGPGDDHEPVITIMLPEED